jgi:hypothetical protein
MAAKKGIDIGTFTIKPFGSDERRISVMESMILSKFTRSDKTLFCTPRITGKFRRKTKNILSDNEITILLWNI